MNRSPIRGLGEIALRVNNLGPMRDFYRDVIGLQLMRESESMAFFRIADGVAGHTQILALFDRSIGDHHRSSYTPPNATESTLDHLAFSIDRKDFEAERERLESLGLPVDLAFHAWVQWRSLYVRDPEGNVVELVCFDPSCAPEETS